MSNKFKYIYNSNLALAAVLILLSVGLVTTQMLAQNLIDPNDRLTVQSPAGGSTVTGSTQIRYIAYDNDQSTIPLRVEVYNASCTTRLRTIVDSRFNSTTNSTVLGWDTTRGYRDGGVLADGAYCLSVCAEFKFGASNYNACSRRALTIRNTTNVAPSITTTPPISGTTGEAYTYNVGATDPDGDPLTYRLLKHPGFIGISGSRVFSNSLGAPGQYAIEIEVRDNFGGSARQAYTLTVNAATPPPQTEDPEPSPDKPTSETVVISLISPTESTVITEDIFEVLWSISDPEEVEELKIEYSALSSESWGEVVVLTDPDDIAAGSYDWDISRISFGEYQIRLVVKYFDGSDANVSSGEFSISDGDDDDDLPDTPVISISNLSPASGSSVVDSDILIGGDISGTEGLSLEREQVVVRFEDEVLADCELETLETDIRYRVNCQLDVELEPGEYQASITVEVDGEVVERDWLFSFVIDPASEPGVEDNIFGLIGLVVGILLCLLLLPILLLTIWRRRVKSYRTTDEISVSTDKPHYDTITQVDTLSGMDDYGDNQLGAGPDQYAVAPEVIEERLVSPDPRLIQAEAAQNKQAYTVTKAAALDPAEAPQPTPEPAAPIVAEPIVEEPAPAPAIVKPTEPVEAKSEPVATEPYGATEEKGGVFSRLKKAFSKDSDKVETVKIKDSSANAVAAGAATGAIAGAGAATVMAKSEADESPTQADSSPSTADILAGGQSPTPLQSASEPAAAPAPAPAPPVEPTPPAPAEQAQSADRLPAAPDTSDTSDTSAEPAPSQTPVAPAAPAANSNDDIADDDDLPDWLKDDSDSAASPIGVDGDPDDSAAKSKGFEEETDDGSDPYGLGDQTL